MGHFWRFVRRLPDPSRGVVQDRPYRQIPAGAARPWRTGELARRGWFSEPVIALKLTPADWQWLREAETPFYERWSQQAKRPPLVVIYEAPFSGERGCRLRAWCSDRTLISQLSRWAHQRGMYGADRRAIFWEAVWHDLRSASGSMVTAWPSLQRLSGGAVPSVRLEMEKADVGWQSERWVSLPASWRRVLGSESCRVAEDKVVHSVGRWPRESARWYLPERQVFTSTPKLSTWINGWCELAQSLEQAACPRASLVRQEAWRVMREFYWHETSAGLAEAESYLLAVSPPERPQLLRRLSVSRAALSATRVEAGVREAEEALCGVVGRLPRPDRSISSHLSPRWRRLEQQHLSVKEQAAMVRRLGEELLGEAWKEWQMIVSDTASTWSVDPAKRILTVAASLGRRSWADTASVAVHELTHVWQAENDRRVLKGRLRLWPDHRTGYGSDLAEAGAVVTEDALRRHLGAPPRLKQYYNAALAAQRAGGDFSAVLAAALREARRERRVKGSQEEMVRNTFRHVLRLYRPTLPLRHSRLINHDQLKYVESAQLARALGVAGLERLLYLSRLELKWWPLYERLGWEEGREIQPFPLSDTIALVTAMAERRLKQKSGSRG